MTTENPAPEQSKVVTFMTKRRLIQKIYLGVIIVLYMIGWGIFHPQDIALFPLVSGFILAPIAILGMYFRVHEYLFIKQWLYITYMVVVTAVFGLAMYQLSERFEYAKYYVLFELGHIFVANLVGVTTAVAVSLPFKIIHSLFFDNVDDLYYSNDQLTRLEEEAFPEQRKKRVEKEKEINKYETFNETQLQVALNNALKEEQFEEANKIKKVLEKKFKTS
jgi:hypothetical protein